ncbi:hypothetical protein B0H13DRAFT_2342205 [Mycena leptocephala]|nr:hypothetical protein B0H13DRAFT_2342205 [Mycena leptocephala]
MCSVFEASTWRIHITRRRYDEIESIRLWKSTKNALTPHNNNNNNNHNHHHPRCVVLVPAASSIGPSIAANPHAAKFLAIRSQQPPVTSHAACARYRLGRKAADRHRTLTRRIDHAQKHLIALHTHILYLLHCHTLLQPATLASVIHDVERASSLCRSLSASAPSHSLPINFHSSSTLLHGSLKLATPPCVPSSTPVDFSVDDYVRQSRGAMYAVAQR